MKKSVRSPGSATIINAIATGFGSAFGIGLDIECEAKTADEGIHCSNDVGADNSLMEICTKKVFNHYNIEHLLIKSIRMEYKLFLVSLSI